jgi:hypothetical protein
MYRHKKKAASTCVELLELVRYTLLHDTTNIQWENTYRLKTNIIYIKTVKFTCKIENILTCITCYYLNLRTN